MSEISPPKADLGFGQLITDSVSVPFRHLGILAIVSVIAFGIVILLVAAVLGGPMLVDDVGSLFDLGRPSAIVIATTVLFGLLTVVLFNFFYATLLVHYHAAARGEAPGIGRSLAAGMARTPVVLLASLLLLAVLAAVCGGVFAVISLIAQTPAVIAAIIAAVVLSAMFLLVIPVAAIEGRGISAFRRALALSEGYRTMTFLAYVLVSLIVLVITLVAGIVMAMFGYAGTAGLIVVQILNFVLSAVTYAIMVAFLTHAYLRMVEIKEGGDAGLSDVFT